MKKSNLKPEVLTPVSTKEMVDDEKKISETAEKFVTFSYLDTEGKTVSITKDSFLSSSSSIRFLSSSCHSFSKKIKSM